MTKVKIGDKVKYFDDRYDGRYGDGNLSGVITQIVANTHNVNEVETDDGVWGARIKSDAQQTNEEAALNMHRYHISKVITVNKG